MLRRGCGTSERDRRRTGRYLLRPLFAYRSSWLFAYRRLRDVERRGVGIQRGARADRHGPVVLDVSNRKVDDGRHAESFRDFAQRIIDGVNVLVRSVCKAPEGEACYSLEDPGMPKLKQHAVDSICRLADVLQKDDAASDRHGERRPT